MTNATYTEEFFAERRTGVNCSAAVIVPLVLKLVPARSVIDVGCGQGNWLAEFIRHGVTDALGIDGHYVGCDSLEIPKDNFRAMDLSCRFEIHRTFDLAVSLEVAEHLPLSVAESFILSLTKLAPAVLFSAAIPFQGGTHHVNEQWPDFWARLFKARGFSAVDCIRKRIWSEVAVDWWYAQNIVLFVSDDYLRSSDRLRSEMEVSEAIPLPLVHPRNYLQALKPVEPPHWRVNTSWKLFVACVKNAAKRRAYRLLGRPSFERFENPLNYNALAADAGLSIISKRSGQGGSDEQ